MKIVDSINHVQRHRCLNARTVFGLVVIALALAACVAKKDMIVPTKYDRTAVVDRYKACVANTTTRKFDKTTKADVLVRNSMAHCAHFRDNMLREYPKRWRENYLKQVDAELYQREVQWIAKTRNDQ